MDLRIGIAGIGGLAAVVLVVGAFLYDKNPTASGIIIAIGLVLAIAVTASEIYLRNKKLNAKRFDVHRACNNLPFFFSISEVLTVC